MDATKNIFLSLIVTFLGWQFQSEAASRWQTGATILLYGGVIWFLAAAAIGIRNKMSKKNS